MVHVGTEGTTTGGLAACVADGVRFFIALPRLRVITGEKDVRFRGHNN